MTDKPTYEELEQRIKALENNLEKSRNQDGAAQMSEQYLRAILDNTNLPIYLKDSDYNYLYINREYERLAHVTDAQVKGKSDYDIFPEPIAELFRTQDEEVKKQKTLVEFTETIELADGEHTFITAKFPLVDAEGHVYAVGGVCTDITSLQKTQENLQESEKRYHSFIASFHGIAYRGKIRTFIPEYFHGAVEKITGYTEKDFLGGNPSWDKVIHPDDFHILRDDGKKMLTSPGYSFRREYRIIRKDGEVRWIFETGCNACDEHDKPVWVEGTIYDITGRKNTENALRESEEKYRTLAETASLGIQISDLEGCILFSNPAHHAIHGVPESQLIGKYIWDFLDSGEERKKLQEYYSHLIQQQPAPETYFGMNKTADGQDIYVQVDWNYMRDTDGEVFALCSIINDVTERIRTEEELRTSENRFRSVIESCPEGMMMYRLEQDGRLVFVDANPAADQILGLDCVKFIGKTIEEAFPPLALTEIPDRYRDVCRTGKPWRAHHIDYEDSQISGAYEVHAFQTEPGKMALFFTDVTKKIRMEEEIQKIQKLESVGILAGGIAHDFNNLLTAILGNISMAKIFSQAGEKSLDRLNDAERATLRARDLTQQLLTFSRGGAPLKTSGSVKELIEDSSSFMLSGSNVTCEIITPDDLWPVEMDEGQISQVIQNMVKNADQAMPEGGRVTIQAENVVVTSEDPVPLHDGKYVIISITDQGVGITPQHLAKVFDPYFSTKQEGSGLGLAASYSIIKNHDGLITVESTQNTGTTFQIYLPASSKMPTPKKKSEEKFPQSGAKILIMDDDPDVLNVAKNMLGLMGYKTETAHDGSEAVQLITKAKHEGYPFDGVILDLTIPGGMGGLATVTQLSRIDPDVKAIVSSGYANDPIMADFKEHGFHGVIAKPYTMEKLGDVLRKVFS